MSFLSVLSLIFVIAKLAGYIDWSWWLVFTPFIIHCLIGGGRQVVVVHRKED